MDIAAPMEGVIQDSLPIGCTPVTDMYDLVVFPGQDVLYELQDVVVWVRLRSGRYYGKPLITEYGRHSVTYEQLQPFIEKGMCWKSKRQLD